MFACWATTAPAHWLRDKRREGKSVLISSSRTLPLVLQGADRGGFLDEAEIKASMRRWAPRRLVQISHSPSRLATLPARSIKMSTGRGCAASCSSQSFDIFGHIASRAMALTPERGLVAPRTWRKGGLPPTGLMVVFPGRPFALRRPAPAQHCGGACLDSPTQFGRLNIKRRARKPAFFRAHR